MDQTTNTFDPYHRWLGIQPKDQPPNHYRLLGIELFESDPEVIRDATNQRLSHVRTYQLGKNSALSQKILNEIAAARVCLLDSAKKAAYDDVLRTAIAPPTSAVPETDQQILDFVTSQPSQPAQPPSRRKIGRLPRTVTILSSGLAAILLALGLWSWLSGRSGTPKTVQPPKAEAKTLQAAKIEQKTGTPLSPTAAAKPETVQPIETRPTETDFPSIAGTWQEGPGMPVVIKQSADRFEANCTYMYPQVGEVRWRMEGTITKDGKVTGNLLHVKPEWGKQLRVAQLMPNGTIQGHASFTGGGHDFTWVRNESPNPKPPLAVVGITSETKVGSEVAKAPPPLAIAPFSADEARKHQELWAEYLRVPVVQTNSIGMKLVLIPPGEFDMGSPKELVEEERRLHGSDGWYRKHLPAESPQHRVRITKPYWLGVTEVTQEEYQRVMGSNPSKFSATAKGKGKVAGQDMKRFPVENVTWDEAVEFCRKLSSLPEEKLGGLTYRLPSEAQWEYACRAGSTGQFSFSLGRSGAPNESEEKELLDHGWFVKNSDGMIHAVGGKRVSTWGLYDMHGNVWEWCQDWYDRDYYAKSPTDDPMGPLVGGEQAKPVRSAPRKGRTSRSRAKTGVASEPEVSLRVLRGGGWDAGAGFCRSAYRPDGTPGYRLGSVGFRVSRVPAEK
ncbi:MAG: SUMF1/EgtB/PvdO family nonheme iron enzyme [Thermoguttaceae bacterium]